MSFAAIAEKILETGRIPDGMAALIDPNQQASVEEPAGLGAIYENDDDIFSPLPLNTRQKAVLERVDSHSQTIVQGPPGTGKTHMAAALLSHLLAQGKRVLVTAETDRALYELRGKMPKEIQELAVSVIGSSESDIADLRVAIDTISRKSSEFDSKLSDKEIGELNDRLNVLGERRVRAVRRWADRMESESSPIEVEGYGETVSRAIEKWVGQKDEYDWIQVVALADLENPFPLTDGEISEWLRLLETPELKQYRHLQSADTFDLNSIPTVESFQAMCSDWKSVNAEHQALANKVPGKQLDRWESCSQDDRAKLVTAGRRAVEICEELEKDTRPWSKDFSPAMTSFEVSNAWRDLEGLRVKISEVRKTSEPLQGIRKIVVNGDAESFVPIARSLQEFLTKGGKISAKPDGTVKLGLFPKRVVRDSMPFFESVRIDGMPPTTLEQVTQFLAYVDFNWIMEDLHGSWSYFDERGSVDPQLQVNNDADRLEECSSRLHKIAELSQQSEFGNSLGFRIDVDSPLSFLKDLEALEAASSSKARMEKEEANFTSVKEACEQISADSTLAWPKQMAKAVKQRDVAAYETARKRAEEAAALAGDAREYARISDLVQTWSRDLHARVTNDARGGVWRQRVRDTEAARCWALAGKRIEDRSNEDLSVLQKEIAILEEQITSTVTSLAAQRAWAQAVGSSRIDPAMRANLVAYTQAVKRLGKGTGKLADQKRREVRKRLDRCRSAVPVWIMPIFKVVEQFSLDEDMFDVVIVDEASQAGVDALFLQFLAPRIVVIGDNKQVSPSAVGVQHEPIQKLAQQYLHDFDDVASWTDPKRSLFDDAEMRYGGRIVLQEHRRCVPEIIEFSNQLVYRPNNIELQPVRQVLPGRLAPFKITQTPNAFQPPTKKKVINTVEADALITRLLRCLNDPAYDGKSMGVISLLSTSGQADYIRNRLLEKLPPEVWENRDLKVGSPSEFQGAERDVIFLSMVTMVETDRRIKSLVGDTFTQRYNVAVSRAKDQVWLFHSAGLENFSSPEDVRARLLQYAYDVALAAPETKSSSPVPNDERVEPFDSLFEQRVYNELVSRGYHVIPQYNAFGYRLDLVVEGSGGRLAVECDGDHWHNEAHAREDRSRQRELERLGWRFARIFESDFYLDRADEMDRVFKTLDGYDITPFSLEAASEAVESNVEVLENVFSSEESVEFDLDLSDALACSLKSETAGAGHNLAVPEAPEREEIEPEEELWSEEDPVVSPHPQDLRNQPLSHSLYSQEDSEQFDWNELEVRDERADFDGQDTAVESSGQSAVFESEYEEFAGSCVSVHRATSAEINEGMLEILEVEGPMLGDLWITRYVTSGGDQRVTAAVKKKLNSSISKLLQQGTVLSDNPANVQGYKGRTFHLPEQARVVVRTRGSRKLQEIPFREIAAVMEHVHREKSSDDPECIMRETLSTYGLVRLTPNVRKLFEGPLKSVFESP
ncbi:superfamily protein I DNA/RNA helicase [Corynebacterium halotolerans YIM 70093 = DSM 44683]|uniref:Superfamily protein I DNA/RNA helicase n=2 Tax=Corynebacterium halotolerans TaxID=225326 RepID=M1MWQ4_9CORY|nr:superfamily protein I DNA/RNA helicase [Corynebacterium halotolerans YIM 70093 = DSM 44683]